MLQGNIEPLIRFNLIGSRSSGVERQLRRQDNQGLLRLRPPDRPSARSVRKNGSCKMGEAAERAAASPKERQSSLFELARNAAEGRVEIGAEGIDHENNRSSDACCDQAIFDRRCARFIPSESNKQSTHVGLLYWLATRNSCTSSYYGQVNSYRDYCDISPIFHDPPQRSRGTDRAFAGSFVEQGRLRERNSTAARLPIPGCLSTLCRRADSPRALPCQDADPWPMGDSRDHGVPRMRARSDRKIEKSRSAALTNARLAAATLT
jgi:hypothetical protein